MKKGFTLIELLAVIVILAIISLIATPIILTVINNVKEESNKRSIDNIIHAAKIYQAQQELNDSSVTKITVDKIKDMINGEVPDNGIIYMNENGEISFSIEFNDKIYTKYYGSEIKKENNLYYIKKAPTTNGETELFLGGPITKESIEKIITVPTNQVPSDADGYWDVTDTTNQEETGKVMAWYYDKDNNGLYEVYIGQNGGVRANPDSTKLFSYLTNAIEIDLTHFDTSDVETMFCMFSNSISLKSIDVSNFVTSKVTDMTKLFGINSITEKSYQMALEEIIGLENFDTSKVKTMRAMFQNCINLIEIDLSSFDTSEVENMSFMFSSSANNSLGIYPSDMSLERIIGIENFKTNKVTNMCAMFQLCSSLTILDLSTWDTNKVTDMSYMFNYTTNLKPIYIGEKWKTASIVNSMFNRSATTSENELCSPTSTHSYCVVN